MYCANRSGRVPLPPARAAELQRLLRREESQGDRPDRGELSIVKLAFTPAGNPASDTLSLTLEVSRIKGDRLAMSCKCVFKLYATLVDSKSSFLIISCDGIYRVSVNVKRTRLDVLVLIEIRMSRCLELEMSSLCYCSVFYLRILLPLSCTSFPFEHSNSVPLTIRPKIRKEAG